MTPEQVSDIRNIALVGPAASGKTTLLDALLAASGGSATDADTRERAPEHSLHTTLAHLEWQQHWINVLDTPGLPDLAGRALAALPAVETVAVTVDATQGIDSRTRRFMDAAAGKCRMLIVTRMDAAGIAPATLLEELRSAFGDECLPLNLPSADGKGVVDCFFGPDESTPTAFSSVREAHERIVDQVVELDEALMARYLEQGQSLDPEQLHAPFEQALREGHLIPVCFTSASSGAGLRELLEIFARLMPDPTEGNPPDFLQGEGAEARPVQVVPDAERHVVAHVFQIANDPYRGRLALFRIHQGTVTPNSQLYIGDARKPFRVAHLFRIHGRQQSEITRAIPGDICALARVDELHRDAVLHDSHDEDHFHLRPPPYPQPVVGLALSPRKHGDEQKLSDALHRLLDEDPCLSVSSDPQSRQTVIRGLGKRHLGFVLEQLASRWNLEVDSGEPAIPYRETVGNAAEARYRHKKQSGGAGQFGEVALRVEPLERGAGFEFVDAVKGGAIPGNFMPAVEKGVRQALDEGVITGFPLQDLRVVIVDGKSHSVDSNEISFVTAARHAFQEAARSAAPLLLEPWLELGVRVPDAQFGDLSGELATRRGHVTGTDTAQPGWTIINALLPMATITGLEQRLKAICAGESDFTLTFSHYAEAPGEAQRELAEAWARRERT